MPSLILFCSLCSATILEDRKTLADDEMAAVHAPSIAAATANPVAGANDAASAASLGGSPLVGGSPLLDSPSEGFRLEAADAVAFDSVAAVGGQAALAAQQSNFAASRLGGAPPHDRYGADTFVRQAGSIPWRLAGAAAAITATGLANWNWGSSPFRFEKEGWFGKDTASLGMDKLGHAYSAYVLSDFFASGIEKASPATRRTSAYTGAILSMGLMTYIEVFDGFSKDHGFSFEDLAVDAAGALFSVARRSVPGLQEKLDFRLLYKPSRTTLRALGCLPQPHCDREGETVRSPVTDYSGQRYLLALKLAGFPQLSQGPFRFLELHAGYYARGFTREEEIRGDSLRRRLFVGAGLNVGELLFGRRPRGLGGDLKSVLNYLQIPYTAAHSN